MEQELAIRLQDNRIPYLTQVEIPVTTADFYIPLEPRPLIVFVDGRVHLRKTQMYKDEELRSLLRKRGYRVLELFYTSYLDNKRDELYLQILDALGPTFQTCHSARTGPNEDCNVEGSDHMTTTCDGVGTGPRLE